MFGHENHKIASLVTVQNYQLRNEKIKQVITAFVPNGGNQAAALATNPETSEQTLLVAGQTGSLAAIASIHQILYFSEQ